MASFNISSFKEEKLAVLLTIFDSRLGPVSVFQKPANYLSEAEIKKLAYISQMTVNKFHEHNKEYSHAFLPLSEEGYTCYIEFFQIQNPEINEVVPGM